MKKGRLGVVPLTTLHSCWMLTAACQGPPLRRLHVPQENWSMSVDVLAIAIMLSGFIWFYHDISMSIHVMHSYPFVLHWFDVSIHFFPWFIPLFPSHLTHHTHPPAEERTLMVRADEAKPARMEEIEDLASCPVDWTRWAIHEWNLNGSYESCKIL